MSVYVTKSYLPPLEEYIEEIKSIWDTSILTNMGDKHKELTKNLKEYLGVPDISLLVNGHMALELALQAFQLKGEVITTPFTFASTTHAIVRNRLRPVFCDIKENDYTMDPDLIENLITEETTAIVPVHVYGNICDSEAIEDIAKRHHLKVIYDAAHAFGEKVKDIGVGNFGDASVFSFHATKVFHSIEGGAVTFHDEEIGTRLYHLKNFGIVGEDLVDSVGANAKMNEFSAAMGLCCLRKIDHLIALRTEVVEHYQKNLANTEGITLKIPQKDVITNAAYFPIVVDERIYKYSRDEIYCRLKKADIFSRKYFYPLTSDFTCYKNQFSSEKTPVAQRTASRVLTLPLSAELSFDMVDKICDIILN